MAYQQKLNYRDLKNRADRVHDMRMDRARAACNAAGLDASIIGVHVHNALVSLHYGNPWPEVNYSLAKKAQWLMSTSFRAGDAVTRLYRRKGYEAFNWS